MFQGSDIYDRAPQISNPTRKTLFPLTHLNHGKRTELVVYFDTFLLSSLRANSIYHVFVNLCLLCYLGLTLSTLCSSGYSSSIALATWCKLNIR